MRIFIVFLISLGAQAGVIETAQAPKKKHAKGAEIRFLAPDAKSAFMGHLTVPPNGKVPEHRDATEEFIYVLEGAGTVWIDDKKHAVKAGSAIYMTAGAKVRFQNGPKALKAVQFFAPKGPEKKYDAW